MIYQGFNLKITTLIVCLLFTLHTSAITIDDLIKQNELTVDIRLKTSGIIIAKQAVTIEIEVATNRWFAKGTQVSTFELANALVLPANDLAINGSKKINGQSWASQIREVTLYPMQDGHFTLPDLQLIISVNNEINGVVTGNVTTSPISFSVSSPDEFKIYDNYLVASAVSINIDGGFDVDHQNNRSQDASNITQMSTRSKSSTTNNNNNEKYTYTIGEAITQTITFTATDLPSMMLPVLSVPQIEGISIYHKPARLSDSSSRGTSIAKRIESFTYIFEKAGEYQLEEQKFYWWDLQNKQMAEVVIPAQQWSVTGTSAALSFNKNTQYYWLPNQSQINILLSIIVFVLLLMLVIKFHLTIINFYQQITNQKLKMQQHAFIYEVENKNYQKACQQLYQLINFYHSPDKLNYNAEYVTTLEQYFAQQPLLLAKSSKLLTLAYGTYHQTTPLADKSDDKSDDKTLNNSLLIESFSISDAKILIAAISKIKNKCTLSWWHHVLQLNPTKNT